MNLLVNRGTFCYSEENKYEEGAGLMLGEKLAMLRKKHGYSQKDIADMLSVTRQTISNWECGQGAPSLDKAAELAGIYHISLDDLAGNDVEIAVREKEHKDLHVLKKLIGRKCSLESEDLDMILETPAEANRITILDVNEEWIRIRYERSKEGAIFRKETVTKLADLSLISGIQVEVTEE
jgi:transcriptional regulator with XRE-family HTH domain